MFANLTGWHFLIILFVVLLLFGAPKLPGLAKSVGQSMKIFKKEVRDVTGDSGDESGTDQSDSASTSTPAPTAAAQPAPQASSASQPEPAQTERSASE